MTSMELSELMTDFERPLDLVEETGERIDLTDGGERTAVLLPAAELAELEHFAQRGGSYGRRPRPFAEQRGQFGPEEQGPYVRYVHADGVRMTFVRDRAVVAELRSADELDWIEDRARMGRQFYMPPKQAAAFEAFLARQPPVGDGIAWIAGGWSEQRPFTVIEFIKGMAPEEVAVAYGADPQDIADGLRLHQVREQDARDRTNLLFDTLAFGTAGEWTWLGHHAWPRPLDPEPAERIALSATTAKAIYTFSYIKDGEYQNPAPLDDGAEPGDIYELIWYEPGELPFSQEAPLGFLNPYIRQAEEHTDWTDGIALFFAGLERAFGLSLPREEITSGEVRCARPVRR
ncbi:type II toxin-antitoxin system Phd/YefM family antitoxin [Streptomyces sp. A7024]|uniref:Type II toxin-antitoxin system Phd/YefM family antitoxin n=1 Tax=Streptomyces coryli TaxID=1128680 RepID=A0A6G4UDM8_9ACTN|nr:type II toxin-antitoxin system Phd/YefM family antitoxin [Streptomyces coryli]NGN69776.1 type II toxin-antitoxin system Phd/YefM family antitoxin [Streptomyces coryli]